MKHAFLLRLDEDMHNKLSLIATVSGKSVNQVVADALEEHFKTLVANPEFQDKLDAYITKLTEVINPVWDALEPFLGDIKTKEYICKHCEAKIIYSKYTDGSWWIHEESGLSQCGMMVRAFATPK